MKLEEVASCLSDYTAELGGINKNELEIPVKTDGSEYTIAMLSADQKQAMAVVIERIKEYCEARLDNTLRLTVSGVAGSGKSTWINTLVSLVRRLVSNNSVIGVYGPTGSAAFNAGGETINRGSRVPINVLSTAIELRILQNREIQSPLWILQILKIVKTT